MNFKKWVKSIQITGYNGARTVFLKIFGRFVFIARLIKILVNCWNCICLIKLHILNIYQFLILPNQLNPSCDCSKCQLNSEKRMLGVAIAWITVTSLVRHFFAPFSFDVAPSSPRKKRFIRVTQPGKKLVQRGRGALKWSIALCKCQAVASVIFCGGSEGIFVFLAA